MACNGGLCKSEARGQELRKMQGSSPSCVLGDFNFVLSEEERAQVGRSSK